jgi:murein DD-endopeptidase MepM/ murein hydrolase activator NlpD
LKIRKGSGKKVLEIVQWLTAFVVIISTMLTGRWYVKAHAEEQFDVYLDDQKVGTIQDPGELKRWEDEQRQAFLAAWGLENVQVTSNMEQLRVEINNSFSAKTSIDVVLSELGSRIVFAVLATELRIDGESIGFFKDRATAEAYLEEIKQPYISKTKKVTALSADAAEPSIADVAEAEFVQRVELIDTPVAPDQITPADRIRDKLQEAKVQPVIYTVEKGDCVSIIALKLGIPQEDIYQHNPDARTKLLRVGQQLTITQEQPRLSVKTKESRTETVTVPSGIVYEKDDELSKGMIQIVSQGKPGSVQKTYQTTRINGNVVEEALLEETVLEPPVQTVVKQGTKVVPGVGTGKFSLPVLSPRVTSGYGPRWGRAHTGLDLVSDQKAILASDTGKVVFAGLKAGYGNTIIIDHQNGFETLYGHLSKIEVREGQAVQKGDKIGVMGSTGHSTGVHLHFEVMRGGQQENPIKYLSI